MRDNQLSRRKVLGALATTGGAGALVGTGTGALFSDEETFTNNGISASKSVAGTVEMDVRADVLDNGTGVIYEITLPEGVNNNPSYIWFRTGCPDPLELGCATEIEVRVKCDESTSVVESGSARDVLNALRNGTLLCSGDAACVQPGEKRTVEIEVIENPDPGYDGPEGPLEFDLEFYGGQCRYDSGAENPFDDYEKCESCDVSTGGGPSESTGKGISFIEIYTSEDGSCELLGKIELLDDYCGQNGISESFIQPGTYDLFEDDDCNDTGYDVEVTDTETKDGGAETVAVAFEVFDPNEDPVDLCRVDLKAGSGQTTYDDQGDFDGNATDGLLDTGGQS